MSFLFPGRKPSKTMWVEGPTVDWGQVCRFLAPTPSSQTVTIKTETRRSVVQFKQLPGSSNGDCQIPAPARPCTDESPAIDALEAALRYRGYYISTTRKRA